MWKKYWRFRPCWSAGTENKGEKHEQPTIIKVRRGINGFKYSACDAHGNFIHNFNKLGDVRKHWFKEINWGQVILIRELDQMPDMSAIEATKKTIESILRAYANRKGGKQCLEK